MSKTDLSTVRDMIWTDIESTGLDEDKDVILQLGMVHVDLYTEEVLRTFDMAVYWDELPEMDQIVVDMHTGTGLLTRCLESPHSIWDVEQHALKWLAPLEKPAVVGGGSLDRFDRKFLLRGMPELEQSFNYWAVDSSTLRRAFQLWHVPLPDLYGGAEREALTQHTAVGDATWSWLDYRDMGRWVKSAGFRLMMAERGAKAGRGPTPVLDVNAEDQAAEGARYAEAVRKWSE